MLRGAVTGFAMVLALVALVVTTLHPDEWPLLLGAFVLLLGTAGEQWRYHRALPGRPGERWDETGERFVDPDSGRVVRVLYDPATGARRYVEVGIGPTNP